MRTQSDGVKYLEASQNERAAQTDVRSGARKPPQDGSRNAAEKPKKEKSRWIYRATANFVKCLLRFFWPTKIYFKERFQDDKRAILICNHYGYFDSNPILVKIFGKRSNILLKSEITSSKFVRECFREVGGIPIRRGDSDIAAVKQVLKVLNNDEQILIYPEGTRNPHGIKEMLPFKEGVATFALKTKAQIVPMMYYQRPAPFRRNRLMVGEPFDLSQFYGQNMHDVKQAATDYVFRRMQDLRAEIDILVEQFHGNKKKYLADYRRRTAQCK